MEELISREYCIYLLVRVQGNIVFTICMAELNLRNTMSELKGILYLPWQSSVKGIATNTVLTMAMPRVNFRHITCTLLAITMVTYCAVLIVRCFEIENN